MARTGEGIDPDFHNGDDVVRRVGFTTTLGCETRSPNQLVTVVSAKNQLLTR
jgi:hypothetical protein